MAKIRKCEKCGNKISIREMPNGKWLPFEYQNDTLHTCIKTNAASIKSNTNYNANPKANSDKIIKNPIKYSKISEAIDTQKNLIFNYSRKTSVGKLGISMIPIKIIRNSKVLGYCLPESGEYTFNIVDMHNIQIIDRPKSIKEIEEEKKKKIDEISYSIYDNSKKILYTFKLDGFSGVPADNNFFIVELRKMINKWIFELFNSDSNFSSEKYNQFKIMNHFYKKKEQLVTMISFDEALMIYQDQMVIKQKENEEIIKINEERIKKREEEKKIETENMNRKNRKRALIKLALVIVVVLWWINTSR